MKINTPKPLYLPWAADTTNKIELTDTDIAQGILYKGPIVSNQLNGMGNDIYSRIQEKQYFGELYNPTLTYDKDNYVHFWWAPPVSIKDPSNSYVSKFRHMIARAKIDGLLNNPPITKGTYNYKGQFIGGLVNRTYWEVWESHPITTQWTDLPINSPETLLFKLPGYIEAKQNDESIRIQFFDGYLTYTSLIYTSTSSSSPVYSTCVVPIKIKATYILEVNLTDTTNYFYSLTEDQIDIEYGKILSSSLTLSFSVADSAKFDPYPWFPVGFPLKTTMAINKVDTNIEISLLAFGATSDVKIEGYGNMEIIGQKVTTILGPDLPTTDDYKDYLKPLTNLNHYIVRSYGGTSVVKDLGSLIIKPFNQWGGNKFITPLLYGCIPLTAINTVLIKDPGWTSYSPLFGLFTYMTKRYNSTYTMDFSRLENLLTFMNDKMTMSRMVNESGENQLPYNKSFQFIETDVGVVCGSVLMEWYIQLF